MWITPWKTIGILGIIGKIRLPGDSGYRVDSAWIPGGKSGYYPHGILEGKKDDGT